MSPTDVAPVGSDLGGALVALGVLVVAVLLAEVVTHRRPRRTTATGVPIRPCAECGREHPITYAHCIACGRASAFIDPDGLCVPCGSGEVAA
jgi:ribosomal protein S14